MPETTALRTTPGALAAHPWLADPCSKPSCYNGVDALKSHGASEVGCSGCQGTGKHHPEFWERCPGKEDYGNHTFRMVHKTGCCDGSGWVLAVDETKAMDFTETLGRPVLRKIADGSGWMLDIWLQPHERESYTGKGPTRLASILDALRQVNDS